MGLLWWQWLAAGLIILAIDIAMINTYYFLWLGGAALVTGLLVALFPNLEFWHQGIVYTALAIVMLIAAVMLKPKRDLAQVRKQIRGKQAVVVSWVDSEGAVRLQAPVGGSDQWPAGSDSPFKAGDQALVADLDISRKMLIIKPQENRA